VNRPSYPALRALRKAREDLTEHTAKLAATTDEMRKRREHREDVWAKSNGIFRDGKFHPEKK